MSVHGISGGFLFPEISADPHPLKLFLLIRNLKLYERVSLISAEC